MICQQCGREAGPDAKFCVDCGSPLELRCPGCQAPYDPGSRFCSLCGRSLPEEVNPAPEEIPEQLAISEPVHEKQQIEPPTRVEEPVQTELQSYPCPRCHQKNSAEAEYCFACGMPLEQFLSDTSAPQKPVGQSVLVPGGFWMRVASYVIDTVAIALIYIVLAFIYGVYLAASGDDLSDFGEQSFFVYVPFLVRPVYETVLVANWSTTLGKRLFGLYVIRTGDSPPTSAGLDTVESTLFSNGMRSDRLRVGHGRAFARHLAMYLSGLILCIGYLQVAFREDKLSLHDQISGTRVVRLKSRLASR